MIPPDMTPPVPESNPPEANTVPMEKPSDILRDLEWQERNAHRFADAGAPRFLPNKPFRIKRMLTSAEIEQRLVEIPAKQRQSMTPFGSALSARQFVAQAAPGKIVRVYALVGTIVEVVIVLNGAFQMAPFFPDELEPLEAGDIPPKFCENLDEIPALNRATYEGGYVPMDEPPGFDEAYYAAWQRLGGKVIVPPEGVPIIAYPPPAKERLDLIAGDMPGVSAEIPFPAELAAVTPQAPAGAKVIYGSGRGQVLPEKKTDTVPQSACKREAMKAMNAVVLDVPGGAGTGTVECDESGRSIKVNLELFRPGSPDVVVQRQPSPATTKDIVKSLAYRLEWADECADFLGEVVATLTLPSNAGKFGLSQFDDYVANLAQRYAKLTAKRPQ